MKARSRRGPRGRARHRRKQIETGLDVIDDGEQSRESFVLYMRRRLTGLGGTGSRPMHADLDAYPEYKASFQQRATSGDRVSNRANLPKAVGAIGYTVLSLIEAECADFRAALDGQKGCTRSIPHRAFARHHRVDRAERALRLVRALSRCEEHQRCGRLGRALVHHVRTQHRQRRTLVKSTTRSVRDLARTPRG